jgi:hypothetical protein
MPDGENLPPFDFNNSTSDRFPNGLGNDSNLLGKYVRITTTGLR